MVVEFSTQFLKELQKHKAIGEAKKLLMQLAQTSPSDGDFIAIVANIVIREKKEKSFRYYFIVQDTKKHIVTKEELSELLIKFVSLSKKNNQQDVINKLKKQLLDYGFTL